MERILHAELRSGGGCGRGRSVVLERDRGLRLEGSAIGLWPNAFKALDALGAAGPLREAHSLIQR